MYSQTCIMSIVALLVMDVRTGALEQAIPARRCHQCSPSAGTSCEEPQGWLTATCPGARPYCATLATAPNFTTTLGCAAAGGGACSLSQSPTQTLELTCICAGQLCNAPFAAKLRSELLNFSSLNANDSALTEAFFKLSQFANVSESALYKAITVDAAIMAENFTGVSTSTLSTEVSHEAMPRAEPLKQQATVPSDDDEDEGEGSGAYEDSRTHIQSQSGSAPAAPSSYLPAEENKAIHQLPNFIQLILPPLLFYLQV